MTWHDMAVREERGGEEHATKDVAVCGWQLKLKAHHGTAIWPRSWKKKKNLSVLLPVKKLQIIFFCKEKVS